MVGCAGDIGVIVHYGGEFVKWGMFQQLLIEPGEVLESMTEGLEVVAVTPERGSVHRLKLWHPFLMMTQGVLWVAMYVGRGRNRRLKVKGVFVEE